MNGMAGNDDGDSFSDDEFPDIPDDEYQKLEQDAITFTQQGSDGPRQPDNKFIQKLRPITHLQRGASLTLNAALLAKSGGNDNTKQLQRDVCSAQQDSSDGTILDEDGLPLVLEEQLQNIPQKPLDESAQREQWRVNRFAQPHTRPSNKASPLVPVNRKDSHQAAQRHAYNSHHEGLSFRPQDHANSFQRNSEEEKLRIKVAELLREKDELTTNLRTAKDEVYARRGEVANIRAKQLDEEKKHQRQLSALQKLKQDEVDKHAVSIQAMKAENAQVASEIQFLRQELKEESRKAQAYQRQLKERPQTDKPTNVNITPKKNRSLRDGFDDDEMMIVSPAKSGRRSKQTTPTANRKRKQPTGTEAGVQPLPLRFTESDAGNGVQTNAGLAKADQVEVLVRKDHTTERHLKLLQRVTNFRPNGGQEMLTEQLFKYSFPTAPKKNFGITVLDAIAKLQGQRLSGDLVQVFVNLWSQAKREEYFESIPVLIEVIAYIIEQDPLVVDADLLRSILPIIQSTIEINATARFKITRKDHLNNSAMPTPTINPAINNTLCLELLHTIACLTTDDRELVELFWRSISTDFALVTLNASQPISDIIIMLQILSTSILKDTFGMICDTAHQTLYEGYICDRLCFLLWELPKPDTGKPPYSQKQICSLRQETLNFLSQLTIGSSLNPFNPSIADNHGTNFLVSHQTAISRLLRSVYDELAAVYLMTPTQSLHVQLVNTAVRILHFVLFSPSGRQVNWQTKLNSVNGGSHKFRVVMARLAYAEGTEPGVDAGISEDTARMATELLEENVTPDEVEDLVRVFEGDGISTSRRTSGITSTQR